MGLMPLELGVVARRAGVIAHVAAALAVVALATGARAEEGKDSCRDCHGNPEFLVQYKKLYDYFQDWRSSVHAQEGVSCADCHGGDPEQSDKKAAHGARVSGEPESRAVDFRNIPETCGQCHEEVLEGYRRSDHFAHLVKAKQEKQGPNCVTCHGSMRVALLDVNTVSSSCARCHNEETGNNPEIPGEAHTILGHFLSIDRFYRYMGVRLEPAEKKAFVEEVDGRMRDLSVRWHTFDLWKIQRETRALLELMREKREEIRQRGARSAGAGAGDAGGPTGPGP